VTTASPDWPTGRSLAAWWRQLEPSSLESVWVGQLRFVRYEVLVRKSELVALDPFAQLLLQAVEIDGSLPGLSRRLGLPPPQLRALMRELQAPNLVEFGSADHWVVTALGRSARRDGTFARPSEVRQVFHFLTDGSGGEAAYLPLRLPPGVTTPINAPAPADLAMLKRCVAKSDEWKVRAQFPADVQEILEWGGTDEWRRVPVARVEGLTLYLLATRDGPDTAVHGYAIRPDGVTLLGGEPVLRIVNGGVVFPELEQPPDDGATREAWLVWARAHGLTDADVEQARLAWDGQTLAIAVAAEFRDQLPAIRDEWVLAGTSRLRRAGRLAWTNA
jgi:hypothetical protein